MDSTSLSLQEIQALRREVAEASASIRAARRLAHGPDQEAPAPFDPLFDSSLERLEQVLEKLDRYLLPDSAAR